MNDFARLISYLTQRIPHVLPGARAHDAMRAFPVGAVIPNFTHKVPPRPGSVLILLFEEGGRIKFPLIKRPEYLGAHSAQISLPGGKAEPDESPIDTALREGEEEIGVPSHLVNVIGTLSPFFVIPSNFMVTPVVGYISQVPGFVPDDREVERIITMDIAELTDTQAIREKEILAAGRFNMRAPHFLVDNEVVWGATAMMLNELRTIILEGATA